MLLYLCSNKIKKSNDISIQVIQEIENEDSKQHDKAKEPNDEAKTQTSKYDLNITNIPVPKRLWKSNNEKKEERKVKKRKKRKKENTINM